MREFQRDLSYALRILCRTPLVTLIAALSLAFGIGINTAVFTLIDGVLLRPLAIPQPQNLYALSVLLPGGEPSTDAFSLPLLVELQSRQTVFTSLFAWSGGGMANFEVDGHLYPATVDTVSGEYFDTLGIRPVLGRFLSRGDVGLPSGQSSPVAVLSYRCWQKRYRSDPAILGRLIRIDGVPLTIIGVAPKSFPGFQIDAGAEATVPVGYKGRPSFRSPENTGFEVTGRLRPGVTHEQAYAQLISVWPQILAAAVPPSYDSQSRVSFLGQHLQLLSASTGNSFLRSRLRQPLRLLSVLAGMVLLIACLNLAMFLAARAASRSQEFQIRLALGAPRWLLVRELLLESSLLTGAAASAGLVISFSLSRALLRLLWTGYVPTTLSLLPDVRIFCFTIVLSATAALLLAIVPAFVLLRSRRESTSPLTGRNVVHSLAGMGRLLVVAQTSLCLVLVCCAVLSALTLHKLKIPSGFRREGILAMQLFPQPGRDAISDRALYYRGLDEALARLPGVTAVSYSYIGPGARVDYQSSVSRTGSPSQTVPAVEELIAPGLFSLLDMRLLAGRDFNWRDDAKRPRVAIISDSLARLLYPGQNPLGQTLQDHSSTHPQPMEIVGVVNSASLWSMRTLHPAAVYRPLLQEPTYNQPIVEIRSSVDPHFLARQATQIVVAAGHHYSLRTGTLEERADMMIANERALALLSLILAMSALIVGTLGLYGLLSFAVTRRSSEIGIRLALGAQSHRVIQLILGEASRDIGTGLAIGIVIQIAGSPLIDRLLFQINGTDWRALTGGCGALLATSLLAAWLPVSRAVKLDPANALHRQ